MLLYALLLSAALHLCPEPTDVFWHFAFPHAVEFWYAYDLEWLAVCDALYRLPGESVGADKELARAHELGLRVYERIQDIPHLE